MWKPVDAGACALDLDYLNFYTNLSTKGAEDKSTRIFKLVWKHSS